MPRITDDFLLMKGHIRNGGWLGFVASDPEADQQDIPNGQLFYLVPGREWFSRTFPWAAVELTTVTVPESTIIVLGRDGKAFSVSASGDLEERVEDSGVGPTRRGPMRQMRTIGDRVIAVGMGRQVYRRISSNRWVRVEEGLPSTRQPGQVIGFNAIDGFEIDDMYAVGWGGEIWHYDGHQWFHVDSPTNLALFDVTCADQGVMYAGGQAGVLLRGHDNQWNVLEYKGPRLEFRSLAWFRGSLYAADGTSLHVLTDDTFNRVDFGLSEPAPSTHLHANDGLLLSTAGKEAFTTTDGVAWIPVPV